MEIRTVGIVGCGLMGSGIAQVTATAGLPTTVVEASQELCDRGLSNLSKRLERLVEKGSLPAEQKAAIQGRLRGTTENVPSFWILACARSLMKRDCGSST